MINDELFKKLQFTQGESAKGSSWLTKLNAIKQYAREVEIEAPSLIGGERGLLSRVFKKTIIFLFYSRA